MCTFRDFLLTFVDNVYGLAGRVKTGGAVGRCEASMVATLQRIFIFCLFVFTIMRTAKKLSGRENFMCKHECRRKKISVSTNLGKNLKMCCVFALLNSHNVVENLRHVRCVVRAASQLSVFHACVCARRGSNPFKSYLSNN